MLLMKKDVQITEGKILPNAIRYTLPIIFTNVLQLFYYSADMFVLGNYCKNPNALGSVGCTGAIIGLIISVFVGFGAAINVVVSKAIGANDKIISRRTVHTSVILALMLGVLVSTIGYVFTPTFLTWMGTQAEYFDGAVKYMQIYFCGSTANIMYFFCAGILRAKGDTVRPLMFSSIGGLCNVVLNLVFVLGFGMDVDGVAIATIAAQVIQATLILIYMFRQSSENPCGLRMSEFCFDIGIFTELVRIGVPLGVRSSIFSLSGVIIQTGVNSLSPVAVTANAAAGNVETYIYNILNAFHHTALTFTSQNYGARKFKRMKKSLYVLIATVTVVGLVLGTFTVIFAEPLISIFKNDPEVVAIGKLKILSLALPYFTCGIMEVLTAALITLGRAGLSTVASLIGVCGIRIVWVYTVFRAYKNMAVLFLAYPVSWIAVSLVLLWMTLHCYKKKKAYFEELEAK